ATGRVVELAGHRQAVFRLAWSADGAVLASGADYASIPVWDLAHGAAPRVLELPAAPLGLAFGPRDTLLIVDPTAVRELDLRTGLTRVRPSQDGAIVKTWLASDGAALVTASDSANIRAWP